MNLMTIGEDKQFLIVQRAGRQGCMLSVGQKFKSSEE